MSSQHSRHSRDAGSSIGLCDEPGPEQPPCSPPHRDRHSMLVGDTMALWGPAYDFALARCENRYGTPGTHTDTATNFRRIQDSGIRQLVGCVSRPVDDRVPCSAGTQVTTGQLTSTSHRSTCRPPRSKIGGLGVMHERLGKWRSCLPVCARLSARYRPHAGTQDTKSPRCAQRTHKPFVRTLRPIDVVARCARGLGILGVSFMPGAAGRNRHRTLGLANSHILNPAVAGIQIMCVCGANVPRGRISCFAEYSIPGPGSQPPAAAAKHMS